jgi:hypothetical protein
LPEAVALQSRRRPYLSRQFLYLGNFLDSDLSVLRMDGTNVTDTGQRLKMPGQPASMRAGPQ